MREGNADDLVAFRNVRVVSSTAPALFCAVGDKRVWLPRRHISGHLVCRGDRGTLRIRRWVAVDRQLTIPDTAAAVRFRCQPVPSPGQAGRLHLLHGDREPHHGN